MKYALCILLIGCIGDTVIEKQDNASPTISITSHGEDSVLQEGDVNQFRAQVSDSNHNTSDLVAVWYANNMICDWSALDENSTTYCESTTLEDFF